MLVRASLPDVCQTFPKRRACMKLWYTIALLTHSRKRFPLCCRKWLALLSKKFRNLKGLFKDLRSRMPVKKMYCRRYCELNRSRVAGMATVYGVKVLY